MEFFRRQVVRGRLASADPVGGIRPCRARPVPPGSALLLHRELRPFRRSPAFGRPSPPRLRPVRLMLGVPCPLARRMPGDIDFHLMRGNTEGEYPCICGRIFPGTERGTVLQDMVMTRLGLDRILRFAFDLAQRRPRKRLTAATTSPGIPGRSGRAGLVGRHDAGAFGRT